MKRDEVRRIRREIGRLAGSGLDWATFASRASDALQRVIPFDRTCWHPVDPGTTLFTGSLVRNMVCSGAWLAHHEYVAEDVNQWAFLARSGYRAGALSHATHGNFSLSARFRSNGGAVGDELRGSFVVDGGYWGAAGFIRDRDRPWFDQEETRLLASLSPVLAVGFRRAILSLTVVSEDASGDAPGLVVLDEQGTVDSVSPAAEHWLAELVELPAPAEPEQSRVLQAVAARARRGDDDLEGPNLPSRVRVQTRSGRWLTLDGICLVGPGGTRVAVLIQPAPPHEIAPLLADAYGLSEREREITLLCLSGMATKDIAAALHISPYTVQDHLKAIFEKTGAGSRAELVGQIFLEQYVPRFRAMDHSPAGWQAEAMAPTATP